jgi:hypothetical protein
VAERHAHDGFERHGVILRPRRRARKE